MAFNVRIFGYSGLQQMHVSQARRFASDSVMLAEEPPLWSNVAAANGVAVVPLVFNGSGSDGARVLGIEVPDGSAIRYELQLLGPLASNARVPGNLSRKLTGFTYIPWAAGATFSFVDASSFP
jgi:hypothetical protein